MTRATPFFLSLDSGKTLHGAVQSSNQPGPRPTVVLCHGFKGFMDWGFIPHLAELLANRGFTAIRFNFTGGGMLPGDELVTDLDSFRRATYSQDLEDLLNLLSQLGTGVARDLVDPRRIGLFGHSRGGGVSLLAAAHGDWLEVIGALVTWSAVGTFDRLSDTEKLLWKQRGSLEVTNTRTGQKLEIDRLVLDELLENRESFDLEAAASRREAPWLIVHGEDDETVPIDEARSLADSAAGTGCLLEIPAASHTFGATHPFAGPTPQLITALNATQSWFREHLVDS